MYCGLIIKEKKEIVELIFGERKEGKKLIITDLGNDNNVYLIVIIMLFGIVKSEEKINKMRNITHEIQLLWIVILASSSLFHNELH